MTTGAALDHDSIPVLADFIQARAGYVIDVTGWQSGIPHPTTTRLQHAAKSKSRALRGLLFEHLIRFGGAREDRTPDLLNAIQALSHLSYDPTGNRNVAASMGAV